MPRGERFDSFLGLSLFSLFHRAPFPAPRSSRGLRGPVKDRRIPPLEPKECFYLGPSPSLRIRFSLELSFLMPLPVPPLHFDPVLSVGSLKTDLCPFQCPFLLSLGVLRVVQDASAFHRLSRFLPLFQQFFALNLCLVSSSPFLVVSFFDEGGGISLKAPFVSRNRG